MSTEEPGNTENTEESTTEDANATADASVADSGVAAKETEEPGNTENIEESTTEDANATADASVADSGVAAQETHPTTTGVFDDAPMPPLPQHPDANKTGAKSTTDQSERIDSASAGSSGEVAFASENAPEKTDNTEGAAPSPAAADSGDSKPRSGGGDYSQGRYGSSVGGDDDQPSRYQDRHSSRGGGGSGNRGRSRYRYRIDKEQFASMTINYKSPDILRRFTTETGTILPRRVTGISAADQRRVVHEIKRARFLALLPMG